MKAHLLFRDRDFDPNAPPPANADDLEHDLGLATIIGAMSRRDAFLAAVARAALLHGLGDARDIAYRQEILQDCQANESMVREMYDLAVEAIDREQKVYGWSSTRYPASILTHAIEALEVFAEMLRQLRQIAEDHSDRFTSDGFRRFFAMLLTELSDDYFSTSWKGIFGDCGCATAC